MNVGNELKKIGLKAAYNYLDKEPETNMPRLMEWIDKFVKEDVLVLQREVFRSIIADKDSNWYQLLTSLWSDIDDDIRKALFENLVINANVLASLQARESEAKHHCCIPWAVALDLGMAKNGNSLSFDDVDDIIEQAKDLGTFMFVLTGKDPLDRKEEVIALCNKHMDCQFMAFTDGMEIDEDFAGQALRVKNFIPAVQVTGKSNGEHLRTVFDVLRRKKLPYGAYCVYDKDNAGVFAQEAFFDHIIGWGAKFCWFFSDLEEGADPVYEVMKKYRDTEPLLTINFCKDQAITGGCMAGKYYCSIDAGGMVKPCVRMSCAGISLKENSLLDAYQSEIFMNCRADQPSCVLKKL